MKIYDRDVPEEWDRALNDIREFVGESAWNKLTELYYPTNGFDVSTSAARSSLNNSIDGAMMLVGVEGFPAEAFKRSVFHHSRRLAHA